MKYENEQPQIYKQSNAREVCEDDYNESIIDEIDSREIFDHIRDINDPEHPLSLEELNVVEERLIEVDNENNHINISFTPTIPHCSMATLIGLSIRVKLLQCLPQRYKVRVAITPGMHVSEDAINKQLADKERIAAALDNAHLVRVINQCISKKQPMPF